jgi:hypothetical protein
MSRGCDSREVATLGAALHTRTDDDVVNILVSKPLGSTITLSTAAPSC